MQVDEPITKGWAYKQQFKVFLLSIPTPPMLDITLWGEKNITRVATALTSDNISSPASDLEDGFWYMAFSGKPLSPGREKLAIANVAISFLPSTFD